MPARFLIGQAVRVFRPVQTAWVALTLFFASPIIMPAALAQDDPPPLRVVTYNLLHDGAASGFIEGDTHLEDRLEMVIRELKALDPDIVGLQEASDSRTHGNIAERLAQALGFHVVFAPATEHIFRLPPLDWAVVGAMGFKEGSAILSRFPIVDSEVTDLPRCRRWIEPRILLRAEIATERGPLQVYSTHVARGDECQMRRVGELVRERGWLGLSLLMGDFNTPETSQILTALRLEAGFVDTFRVANPDAPGPTVWQRIDVEAPTASTRVDFILYLPGSASSAVVRSSRVILDRPGRLPDGRALWPSDHYGVLAEIDIQPLIRQGAEGR
ncbi:endonuclease/exonuclease/phosphatase family protein [Nitrospira japonica]|nr:endonuclease/exonuclease/phosphatase family protein [Nitrospira japonica]